MVTGRSKNTSIRKYHQVSLQRRTSKLIGLHTVEAHINSGDSHGKGCSAYIV